MNPLLAHLSPLLRLLDASPDWSPEDCDPADAAVCGVERSIGDIVALDTPRFQVVDLEQAAETARYGNGKIKRTRFRTVSLADRQVVIVIHQTGVERSEARTLARGHLTTCHRLIGPSGTRYRVHPLRTRLVAANRLDRAPWHAISIELAGNFEGVHGWGDWYKPDRFGRGTLGDAQIDACREEIDAILDEVRAEGASVFACLPHRVAGRNEKGVPNRPLCPGSRANAQIVEWAGAERGLRVAPDGWSIGGTPVPSEWHGRFWPDCRRFVA